MLAKRIIPCLDVKNGETVKGVNFENLRYAGDPVSLAKKYSDLETLTKEELIDEVIKTRIELERTKKGYAVQGGGQEKEFICLKSLNSK